MLNESQRLHMAIASSLCKNGGNRLNLEAANTMRVAAQEIKRTRVRMRVLSSITKCAIVVME